MSMDLHCDGAPNLNSKELTRWADKNSVELKNAVHYHPAGNKEAKINVKKVKRALPTLESETNMALSDSDPFKLLKALNRTRLMHESLSPLKILTGLTVVPHGNDQSPELTEAGTSKGPCRQIPSVRRDGFIIQPRGARRKPRT